MNAPSRSDLLSQLGPRGWFVQHAAESGPTCGCSPDGSNPKCDLGEALWRLRKVELERGGTARARR